MDIKIEQKPAFAVAGVLLEAIDNSLCPSAWDQLYKNQSFESLEALGNGQSYGVCTDVKEGEIINYMAGYDVTDQRKAKALGLTIMEIEATEYAVIPVKGPIPGSIHQAWKFSFLKRVIVIPELRILKSMQKEICIALTTKWNSGFRLVNNK